MKKSYASHSLGKEATEKTNKIRQLFSSLDDVIVDLCPNGREKSLAQTNLEQAAMWTIKSIVQCDPESKMQS